MSHSRDLQQASGMMAHRLPTVMAFVINLGIPPLLFAQVLYGRGLYTSSVLIGAFWISVIFLLMAGYYGLYFAAKRAESRRTWTAPGVAALFLILTIAFIYSNNMTLMIRPQAWISMYHASPSGVQLNTGDPTLLARWFFFIAGAFPVTGAALLLLSLRLKPSDPAGLIFRFTAAIAIAAGILVQAVFGFVALNAQPSGVMSNVMSEILFRTSAYGWVGTAVVLLLVAILAAAFRMPNWIVASAGALAAFLNVASTVVVRDGIRDVTLRSLGFEVWNRQVVTNWSVVGLFLVLFVAGLGVIAYLITVVAKARRIEEKYA